MVLIRNRVYDSAGDPLEDVTVSISLSIPGYLEDGTIVSGIVTETNSTGLWEVDLPPNSDINPENTHYRITEGGLVSRIVAPESGEDFLEMTDLLVSPPEDPGSVLSGTLSVDGRAGIVRLDDRYLPMSTGVISGGIITPNESDPEAFDISALKAFIVDDFTDQNNVSYSRIEQPDRTIQLSDDSKTRVITWLLMAADGEVIQQADMPSPTERRQNVMLGAVAFNPATGSIIGNQSLPTYVRQPANQFSDLIEALGPFSTRGNKISTNGANLTLSKTFGRVFSRAFSYDLDITDPHEVSTPAQTPVQFRMITRGDPVQVPFPPIVTEIDPANFDDDGVITPVGGGQNRSQIMRVWLIPARDVENQVSIQYGQTVFQSLTEALDNVGVGDFVENSNNEGIATLIAYIVVRRTATNLTDTTQARILNAGKFAAP